jgi:hypothetical protein
MAQPTEFGKQYTLTTELTKKFIKAYFTCQKVKEIMGENIVLHAMFFNTPFWDRDEKMCYVKFLLSSNIKLLSYEKLKSGYRLQHMVQTYFPLYCEVEWCG